MKNKICKLCQRKKPNFCKRHTPSLRITTQKYYSQAQLDALLRSKDHQHQQAIEEKEREFVEDLNSCYLWPASMNPQHTLSAITAHLNRLRAKYSHSKKDEEYGEEWYRPYQKDEKGVDV